LKGKKKIVTQIPPPGIGFLKKPDEIPAIFYYLCSRLLGQFGL
jgi:hypothetical protein